MKIFSRSCNGCDYHVLPTPEVCKTCERYLVDHYTKSPKTKNPSQLFVREEARRKLEIIFGISILVVVIIEIIRAWSHYA